MRKMAAPSWVVCMATAALVGALGGCGGNDGSDVAATASPLTCDESMKAAFAPDAFTKVTLVKAFKKSDALLLGGAATPTTPVAANDM